ncbi:transcriptional regulator [Methanoculleus chikugoensis]|uniref:transcriptional regulator n=1 Tax=Methanoculleus chikugoensis TaxID=118126 RepID=UPI001C80245E
MGLTSGNPSAHLRRLQKAGYVTIEKAFSENPYSISVHRNKTKFKRVDRREF